MTATLSVVAGLSATAYHERPELSSSQARTLLASPAKYRWQRDHPTTPTREMLIGTATHTEVLGSGQCWDMLPGDDRRTKAVKDAEAEFRAAGLIALTPPEAAAVRGMADAIRRHPEASVLLDPAAGTAEQALFWTDPATGVQCRAMLDFTLHSGRAIVDLKTTHDASPAALPRHIERYGYHVQQGWYEDGARALGIVADDSVWRWVFVERDPPHLVTVATLAPVDVAYGHERAVLARQIYRDCAEVDLWPGYPDHVITVTLPPWSRRSHDYEEAPQW